MTIPQLPPYNFPALPVPQITPFTVRDGVTMLKRIELLVRYINRELVPFVNENYEELAQDFETQVNILIAAVNAAIESVINSGIEVQDPVVAEMIGNPDSDTYAALVTFITSNIADENSDIAVALVQFIVDNIEDDNSDIANALSAFVVENIVKQNSPVFNALTNFTAIYNVKNYGAKGDGVTDDTTAILTAQTAAGDHVLYFPNGRYLFSQTLTAKTIIGENRQKTILQYTGTVAAIGVPSTPVVQSYHRRIEDITIYGSGVSGGIGLDLNSSSSGMFSRIIIDNFARGIHLRSTLGLPAQCLYNTFIDVTVSHISGYAVVMDDVSSENRFIACRVNIATRGFQINSGNRNTIDNCAIEEVSERGVSIPDTTPGSNLTRGNVISNCRFENSTIPAAQAITISAGVAMTMVMYNRIVSPMTYSDSGTGTMLLNQESGAVFGGRYATANRPTLTANHVGGMIWDTTLGKPIWWNGFNWKDATGATV